MFLCRYRFTFTWLADRWRHFRDHWFLQIIRWIFTGDYFCSSINSTPWKDFVFALRIDISRED